jgi:tetratricopeptide (TPR) repeat protein
VECELKDLAIRQNLDDQPNIADAYYQLGRIYQAWGKYEQAIAHHQQSRELYEQLGKDKSIANQCYWLAGCYREWGKYQQAVECQQQCLTIRQKLDEQSDIASAYRQLGSIYQGWGKYEDAIAHYQQSCELYEQLGKDKDVAYLWYRLADCYQAWGKYKQAVECQQQSLILCRQLDAPLGIAGAYYQLGCIYQAWGKYEQAVECQQQSLMLCQHLDQEEGEAKCYAEISNNQCKLAKNTLDRAAALDLLLQAEQNIRQAIQVNTAGDYKPNLAYDYTALRLLWSERLRLWPFDGSPLQDQIAQFEEYYNTGLTYLAELGQSVDRADEVLDIARAYLEVNVLENLDRAEELARESLQVFQDYNRCKLEAAARKLLGEIYLKRAQRNQPDTEATAHQFLSESLQIYRELDLSEKATEVEQLMHPNAGNLEPT